VKPPNMACGAAVAQLGRLDPQPGCGRWRTCRVGRGRVPSAERPAQGQRHDENDRRHDQDSERKRLRGRDPVVWWQTAGGGAAFGGSRGGGSRRRGDGPGARRRGPLLLGRERPGARPTRTLLLRAGAPRILATRQLLGRRSEGRRGGAPGALGGERSGPCGASRGEPGTRGRPPLGGRSRLTVSCVGRPPPRRLQTQERVTLAMPSRGHALRITVRRGRDLSKPAGPLAQRMPANIPAR